MTHGFMHDDCGCNEKLYSAYRLRKTMFASPAAPWLLSWRMGGCRARSAAVRVHFSSRQGFGSCVPSLASCALVSQSAANVQAIMVALEDSIHSCGSLQKGPPSFAARFKICISLRKSDSIVRRREFGIVVVSFDGRGRCSFADARLDRLDNEPSGLPRCVS